MFASDYFQIKPAVSKNILKYVFIESRKHATPLAQMLVCNEFQHIRCNTLVYRGLQTEKVCKNTIKSCSKVLLSRRALKSFLNVAIETRVLNGSHKFHKNLKRTEKGIFWYGVIKMGLVKSELSLKAN